jgi:hypothetical protein
MTFETYYNLDGSYTEVWQNEKNRIHRIGLPAYILYCKNKTIKLEGYFNNGVYHRLDGPALISYHSNGSVRLEVFRKKGCMDRRDGAAEIHYNDDGSIMAEYFQINDNYIGLNKKGFWALWAELNEEERENPGILKLLAKYS